MTYKDAGVDITAGNQLVERIKSIAERTKRPEMISGLGGFGALCELPLDRYKQPVMVTGTDGVGTKLKIAMQLNQHNTIGIDLVAMCVNDILVHGAEPILFLDYFACGHLSVGLAYDVIDGIGKGCEQAGCALAGGETAEMPGMYRGEDYDLAGFAIGLVEKDHIIDGKTIQPDDVVIGLASNGAHSNGFTLVRSILTATQTKLNTAFAQSTLGAALLKPTRIYVKPILSLLEKLTVKGIAHITGGGLLENIARILPANTAANIDRSSWQLPELFQWLQVKGNLADNELFRTFNCGVGLVVIVDKTNADAAIDHLNSQGETAWRLGVISEKHDGTPVILSD